MKKVRFILLLKKYIILFFYYSGFQYLWEKINPVDKKTPATFPIWLISIYIAIFGVAFNRYENRVSKIENRAMSIINQLTTSDENVFKNVASNIYTVQRLKCPIKPDIFNPLSVLLSFFKETENVDTVNWLKETVENYKNKLNGIKFVGINLNNISLMDGNFEGSYLWDVHFTQSDLVNANFRKTNITIIRFDNSFLWRINFNESKIKRANFNNSRLFQSYFNNSIINSSTYENADLNMASFINSKLSNVNFNGSCLVGSFFNNANFTNTSFDNSLLTGANFTGSNITANDLKNAKNLYATILDKDVEIKLRKINPALFFKVNILFDPIEESQLKEYSKHIFE